LYLGDFWDRGVNGERRRIDPFWERGNFSKVKDEMAREMLFPFPRALHRGSFN
jgi:hypothetical protein